MNLLLGNCWKENPLYTLRLIFYKRDCRGGAGEKLIFEESFKWLIQTAPNTAKKNIKHIPTFGYYKDWLRFLDTPIADEIYAQFANQLQTDINLIKTYQKDLSLFEEMSLLHQEMGNQIFLLLV